ncbi:hypothetical protein JQ609_19965 [Bradyrhizobium sp. AUGA SZCCT0169]|uniref:hypothetical protein n=1 Tax=Bradyrhizobium sp. AUGA SZCCT0169 TaxID=2807663 RepID=UPI001BAADF6B|nr:hypothetical protein [Bradyrhizobium sp. AUGA SZCCT0169]MBR1249191.1 hypothetical protein [Bradyrhizobium sp. AUGA SZCCT0169]
MATAAEFGDAAAKEALRQIEAEDASARSALTNLDIVIGEMQELHSTLRGRENEEAERQHEEELSSAIDALLEKDDECDIALEHARKLLEERRELARAPILRNAKTKFAGALVVRDREVGMSILSYFDRELFFVDRHNTSFSTIVRVADWDSRHFERGPTPGQAARGKRPLTASEKAMLRSSNNPAPMTGGSGFDSQIEHDKWLANGAAGRKPVRDISNGWPAA